MKEKIKTLIGELSQAVDNVLPITAEHIEPDFVRGVVVLLQENARQLQDLAEKWTTKKRNQWNPKPKM